MIQKERTPWQRARAWCVRVEIVAVIVTAFALALALLALIE